MYTGRVHVLVWYTCALTGFLCPHLFGPLCVYTIWILGPVETGLLYWEIEKAMFLKAVEFVKEDDQSSPVASLASLFV